MVRSSSFDDPAVQAGFAAAYDGDPWQDESTGPLGLPGFTTDPGPAAEPEPAAASLAPADAERATGAAPPRPAEASLAAPGLRRPAPPPGRRHRAPQQGALSPGRALAGAVVSVGGVALGILSLLWVTGDAPAPADVAARTAAPTVQTAPLETEQAPADSPPVAAELPVPPPAPPVPAPPVPAPLVPAPPVALAPAPAAAASAVVPITVLNNSRTTGLAARAAATFRDGGWPVAETGNFTGRIRATTVYYAPGQQASARAFADRFPGIERVLPRFDGLPGSGLTVVLTREFA